MVSSNLQQSANGTGEVKHGLGREFDRDKNVTKVVNLRHRGLSFRSIAKQVGISLSTAHLYYKQARAEWRQERIDSLDDEIAVQIQMLMVVIEEAYKGWYRSIGEHVKETKKDGIGPEGKKDETVVHSESLAGNPAYLNTITDAICEMNKLKGLYKVEIDINAKLAGLPAPEQLRTELLSLFGIESLSAAINGAHKLIEGDTIEVTAAPSETE